VPLALGIGSGVFVGRNSGSPVSQLYGPPFEFTGTIHQLTVDVSGKLIEDSEEQKHAAAKVAMARQ
jgi:arylsulfatase